MRANLIHKYTKNVRLQPDDGKQFLAETCKLILTEYKLCWLTETFVYIDHIISCVIVNWKEHELNGPWSHLTYYVDVFLKWPSKMIKTPTNCKLPTRVWIMQTRTLIANKLLCEAYCHVISRIIAWYHSWFVGSHVTGIRNYYTTNQIQAK